MKGLKFNLKLKHSYSSKYVQSYTVDVCLLCPFAVQLPSSFAVKVVSVMFSLLDMASLVADCRLQSTWTQLQTLASQFHQGSNPGPLLWEHRALSTGLPGKSRKILNYLIRQVLHTKHSLISDPLFYIEFCKEVSVRLAFTHRFFF